VTGARSAIEVLRDYLSTRELLLLVDNFEHVVDAAPELTALIGECPRVRLLVTSREMLRLSGEHVYPVQPLPIASLNGERGPAVELFIDRATAIRHDMPLTEPVLDAIAQICERLDGLPLAIELAAARVRVLMPQEILARLHNRLDFLATGPSDFPERQRTLRRTIEWSYDLLTEREQELFRCLSVFRGGFTLEAAEGVLSGTQDLLEGLASLLDKSLIRTDASVSEPRFTMLETLREFALEQLESHAGLEDVRRRHAEQFAEWAAGIHTDGREAEAIRGVELDYDNLRAALDWLLENGDPGRVARAATLLWKFWWVRSLYTEGIEWMERVKAHPGALSQPDAATVEFVIGILAFGNGDYPRAAKALTIARGRYEELGDVRGSALTWLCLGVTMRIAGDMGGETLLRRAVNTLKEAGDDWALAFALFGLGRVILMDGRAVEATPLLEESVRRAIDAGSQTLLAIALVNLAWARMALPDIEGAREAAVRSFEEARAMDNRDSTARAVEALAAIALTEGDAEDAAVLFGAAEAIRRSIGGVVWVPDRLMHVATETTLRDRLGDELYEARYRRGAELPVAEAVKKALECGVHPHGEARAAAGAHESLSG
jgi:predicted ATPase